MVVNEFEGLKYILGGFDRIFVDKWISAMSLKLVTTSMQSKYETVFSYHLFLFFMLLCRGPHHYQ